MAPWLERSRLAGFAFSWQVGELLRPEMTCLWSGFRRAQV